MNRCTKCILPENTPKIEFDARGICNFCTSHTPITYLGQTELEKELKRHLPARGKYDVLVPLSGGKDSTALAIYLRDRIPDLEYVFCDTGEELPETYDYLEKLEVYLGKEINRLHANQSFEDMLKARGGFLPSGQVRWCTEYLKIKPFEE